MTKQSTAAGCMTNGDDAGPGKPGSLRLGAALAGDRIGGLDFLRAIAVLLVLLDHSGVAAFGPIVLIDGGLGVEAFFVISGFLITHLLLKEADQRGRISLLGFYRRRAARLLPAFYAYLLVGLVPLIMAGKYVPWDAVAASALYVINYYQALSGAPTHYLSHCWSLAVEEQFYLLWPLAFVWLLRRRWPLVRVLCIAIAVAWLLKLAYVFAFDVGDAYLYRSLETRGDELAIGCLLAVLLRSESWQRRFEPLAALRWKAIALLAVLLVASITVLRGSVPVKYLVGYSIEPLLVALLLPLVVLESGHRDGLARWFNVSAQ